MTADDGARLTMTAQPIAAHGPKLVEALYTSADGNTQTQVGVEFP